MTVQIQKQGLFHAAPPWVYASEAALLAAAYSMPVVDGGFHNLASWVIWAYAIVTSIVFTIAIFADPIDKISQTPVVWRWVARSAAWGAVAWLAYHGEVLLPALLAYSFILAMAHRDRAIRAATGDL